MWYSPLLAILVCAGVASEHRFDPGMDLQAFLDGLDPHAIVARDGTPGMNF